VVGDADAMMASAAGSLRPGRRIPRVLAATTGLIGALVVGMSSIMATSPASASTAAATRPSSQVGASERRVACFRRVAVCDMSARPLSPGDAPDPDIVYASSQSRGGSVTERFQVFTGATSTSGGHITQQQLLLGCTGHCTRHRLCRVRMNACTWQEGSAPSVQPITTAGWYPRCAMLAPGVSHVGGQFVMWFDMVNVQFQQGCQDPGDACLYYATSPALSGAPWTVPDVAGAFCDRPDHGLIDAQPFSFGGRHYLLFKAGNLGNGQPASIRIVRLDSSGLPTCSTMCNPVTEHLTRDLADRTAYPSWVSANTIEAPQMVQTKRGYFLMFSGGYWASPDYAVGMVPCARTFAGFDRNHACDPTTRRPAQDVLDCASYRGYCGGSTVFGPGSSSVARSTDGELWMAYDGWAAACTSYLAPCSAVRYTYVAELQTARLHAPWPSRR
jgi:hypothetical protein